MQRHCLMLFGLLALVHATGAAGAQAQAGYLGVYVSIATGTVGVDGETVGFAPLETLDLVVSVANEEGGQELFVDGGLRSALALALTVDGRRLEDEVTLSWSEDDERYAFFGGLPSEPTQAGILEPGVALKTKLTLQRSDGAAFPAGRYQLRLSVVPEQVTLPNGAAWSARGGLGGIDFELRQEATPEAHLLATKVRASDAFVAGRFREAAALFGDVIDLDSRDSDGWAGVGASLYQLGDYPGAVENLEKVLPEMRNRAHRSALPLLLAESYLAIGEVEKARSTLGLVVEESEIESKLEQLQLKVARAHGSD